MKKVRIYKGVKVNNFGVPLWVIGEKKSEKIVKRNFHNTFDFKYEETAPKNLIVMYDIPHEQKKERDWFRRHLKKFGYLMIQKSVWVGPSPLPNDFLKYVKSIKLLNNLKTFKLAKPYDSKTHSII